MVALQGDKFPLFFVFVSSQKQKHKHKIRSQRRIIRFVFCTFFKSNNVLVYRYKKLLSKDVIRYAVFERGKKHFYRLLVSFLSQEFGYSRLRLRKFVQTRSNFDGNTILRRSKLSFRMANKQTSEAKHNYQNLLFSSYSLRRQGQANYSST